MYKFGEWQKFFHACDRFLIEQHGWKFPARMAVVDRPAC